MSENTVDVNVDGQTFEVTVNSSSIVVSGGGVTSFNGRTLAVVPELGDYPSSLIPNDSGVAGITVTDALDSINGQLLNPANFVNQFTHKFIVNIFMKVQAFSTGTDLSTVGKSCPKNIFNCTVYVYVIHYNKWCFTTKFKHYMG